MKRLFFCCFLVVQSLVWVSTISADDTNRGRDTFLNLCIACHAFSCNVDGHEANSPKLSGLIGRKAGGVEDFTGYSEVLKNSEVIWDEESLNAYFEDPVSVFPGSVRPDYHKVSGSDERLQLIAYLKTEDTAANFMCKE